MSVEFFECGVLYRGVLSPRAAQRTGRIVDAFRRYSRSSFFKQPINDPLGSDSRVLKAWLACGDTATSFPPLAEDYDLDTDAASWGASAVQELLLVQAVVEDNTVTGANTERTFVQTYPPLTAIARHDDRGKSSCIVGLSGLGEFRTFADSDTPHPTEIIPIASGDVFHFYGHGWHDASNPSAITYRNTLNLILCSV